jgi:hypothetical protein
LVKLRFCEKVTKNLWNHHLRFFLCSKRQIFTGKIGWPFQNIRT